MIKKTQSKKTNQLKYLILLPVLVGMLFYTSCSETVEDNVAPKKALKKNYFNSRGNLKETIGKKETYMDSYIGIGDEYRLPKGKEVLFKDLKEEEKQEFLSIKKRLDSFSKSRNRIGSFMDLKVYNYKGGRKVIVMLPNFKKYIKNNKTSYSDGSVSFMTMDKVPTFPGCEERDKTCFTDMVKKHFAKEFNHKLTNQLGLVSGKKRVFIGFKIDKQGNVVDVKARAPHQKITEEVMRVMNSLPKMIPGEQNGKPVAVKYSIPFTLLVEG